MSVPAWRSARSREPAPPAPAAAHADAPSIQSLSTCSGRSRRCAGARASHRSRARHHDIIARIQNPESRSRVQIGPPWEPFGKSPETRIRVQSPDGPPVRHLAFSCAFSDKNPESRIQVQSPPGPPAGPLARGALSRNSRIQNRIFCMHFERLTLHIHSARDEATASTACRIQICRNHMDSARCHE